MVSSIFTAKESPIESPFENKLISVGHLTYYVTETEFDKVY